MRGKDIHFLHCYSTVFGVLEQKAKGRKEIQIKKKSHNPFFGHNDPIHETLTPTTRQLPELMNTFRKGAKYKVQTQNSVAFQ